MKKKLMALMLSVSMMVGLTACGGGGAAGTESGEVTISGETETVEIGGITYTKASDLTDEEIELTYFHFDQDETVQALAARFTEIYPNIKVNAVYQNVAEYNDALLALVANGDAPDIIMYSDADFALSNVLLADITNLWNSDPETKNIASTINDCGIGMFGTQHRFAVPVKFFPGVMYIDLNVLKTLNIEAPARDWTWKDMISLIKKATVKKAPDGGAQYFGCGFYNRLDSYYGIAADQNIKGEFGFDGKDFDLGVWAVGEQEFAELKQGKYIAPTKDTMEMENWMGQFDAWCGASGRVALFTEAFWTFQGTWNTEAFEQYNLDIVPYVVPAVSKEDASADHHSIATIDFGGLTTSCKHAREAYEVLKFMSFGKDGWKTRIQIYNDETKVNANGLALKYDVMPAPITTDEEVWNQYIEMYCKGMDETHVGYWKEYFKSCMQPIPYGWTSIAGYWNYCDEYFNKIDIHAKVDGGTAKAADYADEATKKANYYHAKAMLDYFGPNSYNVLSDAEVEEYTTMMESNS
ncbi:MAG: ABC transporter substrate-binding protein [Eubacterium sp.]|nr:ABC transporter substrate-binding protein [Eubacterium sp.]